MELSLNTVTLLDIQANKIVPMLLIVFDILTVSVSDVSFFWKIIYDSI